MAGRDVALLARILRAEGLPQAAEAVQREAAAQGDQSTVEALRAGLAELDRGWMDAPSLIAKHGKQERTDVAQE